MTTYRVHRASHQPAVVVVKLPTPDGDKDVQATVDGLDVELVPVSHPTTGTIKLHFIGDDIGPAKDRFHEGDIVSVDWLAVDVHTAS